MASAPETLTCMQHRLMVTSVQQVRAAAHSDLPWAHHATGLVVRLVEVRLGEGRRTQEGQKQRAQTSALSSILSVLEGARELTHLTSPRVT